MSGWGVLLLGLALLFSPCEGFIRASPAGCNAFRRAQPPAAQQSGSTSNVAAALELLQQTSPPQQQGVAAPSWGPLSARSASEPEDLPTSEQMPRESSSIRTKVLSSRSAQDGAHTITYLELQLKTKEGISVHDITPAIREVCITSDADSRALHESGVTDGTVTVLSKHTTTAVTLNEHESRLIDDIRQFCYRLAPPSHPYLHNDIHLRPSTEDDFRRLQEWQKDVEGWRAQEPKNAHSHLLSMLIGNSLSLPVANSELAIGRWQSVMLVELDGPRPRSVGVQISGFR